MSDQYYTIEEVMKKLGKSRSTVLRDARAGHIPFEREKGKTKGRLYPKQAIDALAEIQRKKKKDKNTPRLIFSPSTPNDLWAEVTIGRDLYGEDDIVPYKQLLEWHEVNDEIYMSLKEEGSVVAYSSLMPLEEDVIRPLLQDKIRERDIPINAIRQWTDPRISVYIASITVKPTENLLKNRERGLFILRHTLKWALSMNRQSDIKNWYGIGATKEGQQVFERLGFTEIISLYDGERKGYYMDDVKRPVKLINQLLQEMRPI
jgi:predicted DNA-binding transcriptional regulator AlpA